MNKSEMIKLVNEKTIKSPPFKIGWSTMSMIIGLALASSLQGIAIGYSIYMGKASLASILVMSALLAFLVFAIIKHIEVLANSVKAREAYIIFKNLDIVREIEKEYKTKE